MWRTLFILSVGVVYASTHWPRLRFQTADQPIDKFLHAGAFGILTAMLWQTQWLSRRWVCMLVVAVWAAFDEATQSIPGLGRSAEWDDYSADLMGVLIAGAFLAASRPVAGSIAAVLARRRAFLVARLLDRPLSWLHIATGSVLGIALGCVGSIAIDSRFPAPRPWHAGVVGAIAGLLGGAFLMREFGVRALQRRMMAQRPCLRCGTPSAQPTESAAIQPLPARAPCRVCAAPLDALAWSPFSTVSGSSELRLCVPVVLQSLAIIIVVGLVGPNLIAYSGIGIGRSMAGRLNAFPLDLQRLIDITLVAGLCAWSYRRCRVRIARAHEQSGQRCLACGYDLRATSTEVAAGVCTECGEQFVRGPGFGSGFGSDATGSATAGSRPS